MLEQEPLGTPVMAGSISISSVSVLCTLGARYSGLEAMSMRVCMWSDSKGREIWGGFFVCVCDFWDSVVVFLVFVLLPSRSLSFVFFLGRQNRVGLFRVKEV